MSLDQRGRVFEVWGALIHVFERAAPEGPLLLVATGEGEKDRQGDLAVAGGGAHSFAELWPPVPKIEHVVDQLKRDSKVPAELIQRGLLALRPFGNYRADTARRRE